MVHCSQPHEPCGGQPLPGPQQILDAEDAPAAYEWANRQFGGDLLPPKGHADYNKTLAKFQYVRRLYKK